MTLKNASTGSKYAFVTILRQLVKAKGLDGLDVRKIAKAAGCSVGTFYNHYKTLDDLIICFNGTTLDILTVCMFENITASDSAKEIIHKICQNYIAFAEHSHAEWFLLLEYPLKIEIPTWYKEQSEQLFQKISNTFHPILRGPRKDTEKAVKILWSALHGICSLSLKQRLRFKETQNTLELCQDMFHNYILGYRIGVGLS